MARAARVPGCPRCGYDQSGVVATWPAGPGASCPVRGLCTECGLEFAWGDVLGKAGDRLPGFFEHAHSPRAALAAVWRTWWLAIRPWAFWSRVQLHMRPRIGRAAAWAFLLFASLWAARVATDAALSALESQIPASMTARMLGRGVPLWYLSLTDALWPFGSTHWVLGAGPLAPPGAPAPTPGARFGWQIPFFWRGDNWVLLVSMAAWPLLFLLLPLSRRVATVGANHLFRGLVYSGSWLVVAVLPWVFETIRRACVDAGVLLGWSDAGQQLRIIGQVGGWLAEWHRSGPWFIVPVWCWLWVWWWMAIARGYRLPHALGVAAAFGAINGLITALAWCVGWLVRVM